MSVLRSDGWSVRPSFSPHGPTEPVVLLFDDSGVTQLAGDPAVAWQTPWSEVAHLRLVRRRRGAIIVAVVAGRAFRWHHRDPLSPAQIEGLVAVISRHGGRELPRSRRQAAAAVAGLVTLASFGGYVGGLFVTTATSSTVTALAMVNLSARDVAGNWGVSTSSSTSELATIMPAPGQVISLDPSTTLPPQDTAFTLAATHFQRCLGVTNVSDRIYGLAGRSPTYQVSSPVLSSSNFGGIQVQSTAQFYASSRNVASDVAEMSRPSFGRCFVESNADLMVGRSSSSTPNLVTGVTYPVHTFARGWVRAGAVAVSLPTIGVAHAHLVIVVEAAGHYEVTMAVLVVDVAAARVTIDDLANSLLVRVASSSAVSA